MVAPLSCWAVIAAEAAAPVAKQLDGATRARMFSALVGLVILGFAMIALTWLGGRAVRRTIRREPLHDLSEGPADDAWARKPLKPVDQDEFENDGK